MAFQGCGTELSENRLSCPVCHRLVHKEELERLAGVAAACAPRQDTLGELRTWCQVLELLPPGSRQYRVVSQKASALSRLLDEAPAAVTPAVSEEPSTRPKSRGGWWGVGGLALLLWKLKAVVAFVATKAKFLLAGLTKSGTFFSMFLSLGVYWAAFGWKFGLGLVISIYIHEMGHVAALRRFGIAASAPMFIPGLGAFVRLNQYPVDAREDARVGLAGPLWGLGAAVGAYLVFLVGGGPVWAAVARIGAWINLFNLFPVWQLDGSRGFRALSRHQRFWVTIIIGVAWFLTAEGLLLLLLVAAGWRAWTGSKDEEGDRIAFVEFVGLVVALSLMTLIPVPVERFVNPVP